MSSTQQSYSAAQETSIMPVNDFMPIFYIAQHETKRTASADGFVLREAQDLGYDTMTTPITTDLFHSRVLALLSSHISELDNNKAQSTPPAPIIPPLTPVDTPLSPDDGVSQLIAYAAGWVDLCSPDPLIANVSRQVLAIEITYASFCGISNITVPGPRLGKGQSVEDGLIVYARAIKEALSASPYVQVAIQTQMYDTNGSQSDESMGDLAGLARESYSLSKGKDPVKLAEADLYGSWDAWNVIRSVCRYNARLSVVLSIPRQLPLEELQARWFAEPVRMLFFSSATFVRNRGGHPVLGKSHQKLISKFIRLKHVPWFVLSDVGNIPNSSEREQISDMLTQFPSLGSLADASNEISPTPAEAAKTFNKENTNTKHRPKDLAAHLIYLRHLQRNQEPRTPIERFGAGFQDYLQAPLQPLTDNLESITYEVFEKDPVKYDWYEAALIAALGDWMQKHKPTSSKTGAVVIAVAGSGRGPLVSRALSASEIAGMPVEIWAVEKNPNAYVLLQRNNETRWGGVVNVVKSDMRAWKGPLLSSPNTSASQKHGKVDILVSELLGSFADNELSPECLDGVQHVLAPDGISIPSSYTAHLSPILAPRLQTEISIRAISDPLATEIPYVVMLHAIDFLATSVPDHPRIQQTWQFVHPLPSSTLSDSEARRSGGVSGGGGGSMSGGDGANEHNTRYARLKFVCKDRGVVNGLAGYFEAVLYDNGKEDKIELSTRPDTIEQKSKDMTSWFPIFFPLKDPLYFPDDTELEVTMWRQTDDRKVWYEWLVEAFTMIGPDKRIRVGISDMGSSRQSGCLM